VIHLADTWVVAKLALLKVQLHREVRAPAAGEHCGNNVRPKKLLQLAPKLFFHV
jgi:hypothetical protein